MYIKQNIELFINRIWYTFSFDGQLTNLIMSNKLSNYIIYILNDAIFNVNIAIKHFVHINNFSIFN